MDYTSFFYSIAGCSATIIAIIGGFIASKLISISSDRDAILDKIKEIEDELGMKTRQYNEVMEKLNDDDAFEFVRDNISMLMKNRSIDVVYKTEEKPSMDYTVMERYWRRALDICEEIANLDKEYFSNTNSDKVPVILAKKYTNDFDYEVCKKILHEIEKNGRKKNANTFISATSLIDFDDIVPQQVGIWYHQKKEEAEKLELRIEELEFEKKQYEEKKKLIKKPKGMKAGLCIFAIFSVLGVFFPLVCALIDHVYSFGGLCMPIISLILFGVCTLITFIYLALLLRWKNVDKGVIGHESDSSEGKL
ncbi:MAG: hypothetical protein ACI4EX_01050 [Lachnospiraceae bacterium]